MMYFCNFKQECRELGEWLGEWQHFVEHYGKDAPDVMAQVEAIKRALYAHIVARARDVVT